MSFSFWPVIWNERHISKQRWGEIAELKHWPAKSSHPAVMNDLSLSNTQTGLIWVQEVFVAITVLQHTITNSRLLRASADWTQNKTQKTKSNSMRWAERQIAKWPEVCVKSVLLWATCLCFLDLFAEKYLNCLQRQALFFPVLQLQGLTQL